MIFAGRIRPAFPFEDGDYLAVTAKTTNVIDMGTYTIESVIYTARDRVSDRTVKRIWKKSAVQRGKADPLPETAYV